MIEDLFFQFQFKQIKLISTKLYNLKIVITEILIIEYTRSRVKCPGVDHFLKLVLKC